MVQFAKLQAVLFADGCSTMTQVFLYGGAAMVGDPTAYVMRQGSMVWVKPGESVEWVEAVDNSEEDVADPATLKDYPIQDTVAPLIERHEEPRRYV